MDEPTDVRPASRLLRDPLLWAPTIVGVLLLAPSLLPLLPAETVQRINLEWSDPILLLLVIPGLLAGVRSLAARDERRFWYLLAAALGSFLAAELIDLQPGFEASVLLLPALKKLLFVGLYLFGSVALELKPHAGLDAGDPWRWRRRLEAAGVVVLGLGLLVYFSLIPELLAPASGRPQTASSLLYAVFDLYLLVRILQLRSDARARPWPVVYALLAAVVGFWLAADLTEAAYWAGWLSDPVSTRILDLLWLPPFLGLALAASWRRAVGGAAGEGGAGPPAERGRADLGAWALWRRPLWVQAAVLPAVHVGLDGAGVLAPETGPVRQGCALATFLALVALAVYDQKRLEEESNRFEREASAAREAEMRAYRDPLTGLPNRYLLLDHLGLALAQARRTNDRVAVVYLDLDRFKIVNSSLGHQAGDRVLHAVAARLGQSVRSGDTLGRMGGDEFVLVAPGVREAADAHAIVGKLIGALRKPFWIEGVEMFVSASAGVALYPDDGELADDLLRRADRSMMRAKELGGDRSLREQLRLDSGALPDLDLETALRRGLLERSFSLVFQPIYDLGSGRVRTCEALLRWQHPVQGLLGPARFLATAESIGVLSRLTPWLLTNACRIASFWPPVDGERIAVSVNLSARQFLDPELPRHVEMALAESRTAGRCLQLEITESVAMAHPERMARVLAGIRELGVTVAIDDFGTGYSSLASLRLLPLDTLKIDANFVRGIHDSSAGTTIVTTVLAMAGALGLSAVAEGVERPDELATLRALGCRFAQGYLLARPLDPERLGPVLSRPLPVELRG